MLFFRPGPRFFFWRTCCTMLGEMIAEKLISRKSRSTPACQPLPQPARWLSNMKTRWSVSTSFLVLLFHEWVSMKSVIHRIGFPTVALVPRRVPQVLGINLHLRSRQTWSAILRTLVVWRVIWVILGVYFSLYFHIFLVVVVLVVIVVVVVKTLFLLWFSAWWCKKHNFTMVFSCSAAQLLSCSASLSRERNCGRSSHQ